VFKHQFPIHLQKVNTKYKTDQILLLNVKVE